MNLQAISLLVPFSFLLFGYSCAPKIHQRSKYSTCATRTWELGIRPCFMCWKNKAEDALLVA